MKKNVRAMGDSGGDDFPVWLVVERVSDFLSSLPFALFCLLVFALLVVQNGVWAIPNLGVEWFLSTDITKNVIPEQVGAQYLYSSFLGQILAFLTGANASTGSFFLMHLYFLIGGFFLLAFLVRRKFGDSTARAFLMAFGAVPLSNVLINWLGCSDVFVFILATLLLLTDHPIVLGVLSFVLGVAHFEQGLLIVCSLIGWRILLARESGEAWRKPGIRILMLLVGVGLAKLVMHGYFEAHQFDIKNTRFGYSDPNRELPLVENYFRNLCGTLFAFHNVFWIFIFQAAFRLWKRQRFLFWYFVGLQVFFMVVTIFTLDVTRVFNLLIWLTSALLIFQFPRRDIFSLDEIKTLMVLCYILNFLVPKMILWEGHIHSTAGFYDLAWIGSQLGFSGPIDLEKGGLLLPYR